MAKKFEEIIKGLTSTEDIDTLIEELKQKKKELAKIEIERKVKELQESLKLGQDVYINIMEVDKENGRKKRTKKKGVLYTMSLKNSCAVKVGKKIYKRGYTALIVK